MKSLGDTLRLSASELQGPQTKRIVMQCRVQMLSFWLLGTSGTLIVHALVLHIRVCMHISFCMLSAL